MCAHTQARARACVCVCAHTQARAHACVCVCACVPNGAMSRGERGMALCKDKEADGPDGLHCVRGGNPQLETGIGAGGCGCGCHPPTSACQHTHTHTHTHTRTHARTRTRAHTPHPYTHTHIHTHTHLHCKLRRREARIEAWGVRQWGGWWQAIVGFPSGVNRTWH